MSVFFVSNTASALTTNIYIQPDESAGYSIPTVDSFGVADVFTIGHTGGWTGNLNNGFSLVLSSNEPDGTDVTVGFESCCLEIGGYFVSTNTVHVTSKAIYTFTFSGRTDIDNPYSWNAHLYRTNNNNDLTIYGKAFDIPEVMQYPAYYLNTNPSDTSLITTLIPVEGSNVNAYFTVSGVYNNDGTYETINFELFNDTDTSQPAVIVKCIDAQVGVNLPFRCSYMGLINNSYHITPYLQNDAYSYPFGALVGAIPQVNFSTNSITTTPPIDVVSCGSLDVGCYVVEGIKFLFLPDIIQVSRFTNLIDSVKNKPPIGYITGTISALGSISSTATPTLAFANFAPLNSLIFTPLKQGITWVLWLAFLFVLFKKFSNFQL